jgi:hypothetical protein
LSNTAIALRVLFAGAAFVTFCWFLIALVRYARRGGKGV